LLALRHGAELIDEIRIGGGPFSRSFFNAFNKQSSRRYQSWMDGMRAYVREASSLEAFACEVALSLQ
jgi:hypothetical protein